MDVVLGLSPCPNDTFIFHALLHGLIETGLSAGTALKPYFADVETLNAMALKGELPVTKLSVGVVPGVLDRYVLLSAGGALGWGCGPMLVAARKKTDPESATIAIPGRNTTANLLLNLHGGFRGPRREMVFSEIMPALAGCEADMGLIIHEGRFTWERYGFFRVLDFGQWWENTYKLPLPLGCIAVRRDVAAWIGNAMEKAIRESLRLAWSNPGLSAEFIKSHAQEMAAEITAAHIKTFVNEFSLDLGASGRAAIRRLLEAAGVNAKTGVFWGE